MEVAKKGVQRSCFGIARERRIGRLRGSRSMLLLRFENGYV